jgi:hypothetical protein
MFRVPILRTAHATATISMLPALPEAAPGDPTPPLTSSEQRELVPAYFYPDLGIPQMPGNPIPGEWQKMCDVAKRGSIIIANEHNGDRDQPGAVANPDYQKAVAHCQRKGYKVVSYVATTYGTKARDRLEAQVRNQLAWYKPNGIFLDEMNNSKGEPAAGGTVQEYYTWISGIIRQGPANPDGSAKLVIGNPGNVSEPQGDWAVARPAGARPVVDILVVFEGFAKDYKSWSQPAWVYPGTDRAHAYRFAHLVHDVGAFPFSQERAITELSRKHHAGYVYVTTEVTGTQASDNPHTDNVLWNQLAPSWFSRIEPTPPVD